MKSVISAFLKHLWALPRWRLEALSLACPADLPCSSLQAFCPGHRLLHSLLPDDISGRPVLSQAPGRLTLHHPHRRYPEGRGVNCKHRCSQVEREVAVSSTLWGPFWGLCPRHPGHVVSVEQRGLSVGCVTLHTALDFVLPVQDCLFETGIFCVFGPVLGTQIPPGPFLLLVHMMLVRQGVEVQSMDSGASQAGVYISIHHHSSHTSCVPLAKSFKSSVGKQRRKSKDLFRGCLECSHTWKLPGMVIITWHECDKLGGPCPES